MPCQLCLVDKSLIRRSHIVPNFLYKSMFSISRKLISVNINNPDEKIKYMQSGYTEGDLLCADCDNRILGSLERYANNHIYCEPSAKSGVSKNAYLGDGEIIPYVRYENLDYTKTKLFFLSILWRCHISKNQTFSMVDLGIHAEVLRKMIIENDPGKEDEYEVVLVKIDTDGSRPSKSVIEPRKIQTDGNTFYIFHINEIIYHFNISKYNKISLFTKGAIRKDNILDIATLSGKWARAHFDAFMGQKLLMKSNIRH